MSRICQQRSGRMSHITTFFVKLPRISVVLVSTDVDEWLLSTVMAGGGSRREINDIIAVYTVNALSRFAGCLTKNRRENYEP